MTRLNLSSKFTTTKECIKSSKYTLPQRTMTLGIQRTPQNSILSTQVHKRLLQRFVFAVHSSIHALKILQFRNPLVTFTQLTLQFLDFQTTSSTQLANILQLDQQRGQVLRTTHTQNLTTFHEKSKISRHKIIQIWLTNIVTLTLLQRLARNTRRLQRI